MSLQIRRIDDTYVALDDDHQIVLTPAGYEIRTRFPGLLQETLEDLETYGSDPEEAISTYSLVCTYIDFARRTSKQTLIEPIVHDLPHDIVFDLPASPEAHRFLYRCYRNVLFDRLGVVPSLAVPPGLDGVKDRLISKLHGLSKRQLSCVIYFSASLGSALLGLALVTHSINLGGLAQAYCSRLHRYFAAQSDSVGIVEMEVYGYAPELFDEQYCDSMCRVGSEYDHPVPLTSSCSVAQMLEKVQRFCGFPDE